MRETFICSICGEELDSSDCHGFDDQELCGSCLEAETVLCHECGGRIWRDDSAGNSTTPLCQRCYDYHYTECTRCGALIRSEDAHYTGDDPEGEEPLCEGCCTPAAYHRAINDYYYKPTPLFYGEGGRFFGVELEIDGAGEYGGNADELLGLANRTDELIYCKHDGSLDDGFEIVTHPMTLAFHRSRMPWPDILEKAASMGYTSHKARTCGLHIHVNRSTFGETEEEQDARIARVLYFFEKHWEELLKFSRRTERQLKRWAARYGYQEQPMEILDHAKKGFGGGRYSSVNLQNRDTVEFRIFRGTLKYNTLIATLQLVDRLCSVAVSMSDEQLKGLSWTSFAAGIRAPELIHYLKERRLYVNEPVDAEVEI
ncbi:hypothetical protein CE91St41_04540 [Oscillospiraceae bacterium]|nr:hypothetical protein CE91St40_04560 [Oscillospiraceae bacterium]BDF73565.1 hypothetical protein CE91St41_04540 [Oscillospiraceae bacterium]